MNSHVNLNAPYGNHAQPESLFVGLKKHGLSALITLAFSLCMLAMLFVSAAPISALIPSFYVESATIGFGLLASLLLLRAHTWRPFYFPVIAFLPICLLLLVAAQIALNLMAYWQQHVIVIAYLLWATLLMVLGAELRREFDLKKIVPVMASALLLMGVIAGFSAVLLHWSPNLLATGLALVSLVYLASSNRLAKGAGILLAFIIIGTTAFAYQTALGTVLQSFSFLQKNAFAQPLSYLQHLWVLTQESWHIFLANPLLGAGWGQFAWQDLQLADVYPQQSGIAKHPHNFLMQLLAETGIAGFAIVVVGLGLWLQRNVFASAQSNALLSANSVSAALLQSSHASASWDKRWLYACLSLLGIVALFNDALQTAPVLGLGAVILGLLEERILKLHSNISAQFKDTALLGQLGVFTLFVIGSMVLITTYRQYTTIENWYNHTARFTQFQEQQMPAMLTTLSALRHQSLLTPYIDTGIVRALPNHPKLVQDKLAINTQLLQHSPQAPEAYNQTELLAMAGQTKVAKQQLQRAINRHPDYLYGFSMKLLKTQSKQTLPLLFLIVRHNKKEIAEEQAQAKTNSRPNTHAPMHNKNLQKTKATVKAAM